MLEANQNEWHRPHQISVVNKNVPNKLEAKKLLSTANVATKCSQHFCISCLFSLGFDGLNVKSGSKVSTTKCFWIDPNSTFLVGNNF